MAWEQMIRPMGSLNVEVKKKKKKPDTYGNSMLVQWLGLHASTAGSPGLISGWGTKILQAAHLDQKKKKKKNRPRNLHQSWHCRSFWGKMRLFCKWSHEDGLFVWKK